MNSNKRVVIGLLTLALSVGVFAQSGTNSPYSQYGLGLQSEQATGFSRGMNGLGLGFREHNQVNFLNPASYSAIDSLTFIFDVGFSGQLTNFNESGKSINAKNADFEYAVAAFRLFKNLGLSFGILPYTNVGYAYASTVDYYNTSSNYTNSFSGSGGLHQVFVGLGWQVFKGLSIGTNVSYLWGEYSRSVLNSYSDDYAKVVSKLYSASVTNYKLDFGVQYTLPVGKKDNFTLGVTYSPGHALGADALCKVISTNPSTAVSDTASYSVHNGLHLPTVIAGGVTWNHDEKLKLGFDYNYQNWAANGFPVYSVNNQVASYALNNNYYKNRHKFTIGGQYCGDENSRSFIKRMRFRAGASYASPYYRINGQDGPNELSVSAGVGVPIVNSYNNRSVLNVSVQWARSSAKNFITENTFRINIGLTFNERWFMKWKVE